MRSTFMTPGKLVMAFLILLAVLISCARAIALDSKPWLPSAPLLAPEAGGQSEPLAEKSLLAPTRPIRSSGPVPTPDAPHRLPALRSDVEEYQVRPGDTLNQIAQRYTVAVEDIVQANALSAPDLLEVGQLLVIPPPKPGAAGPSFKIIPDSELVYGPASADFNPAAFIQEKGGYLSNYSEELEGDSWSGAEIVERISQEYSVNPRLLLAVLEYQSQWVTNSNAAEDTLTYPIGIYDSWRTGLYRQLAWAADRLNRGYYLWRINALAAWNLPDGSVVPIVPTINAGTAALQHLFSQLYEREGWERAVSEKGLFATYSAFFGYPFNWGIEPLLPPNLTQPPLQLPFQPGETWRFTGGPHGGWGSGSAWAALDFAPPGKPLGCVQSDAWVVAIADGLILRAQNGAVVQDLDGDGLEQTGWTILYMHIESQGRVNPGTFVQTGERIGHPSCEGGVSTGTHLHLARRYNGEWIPADQSIPFVLDGWVSRGLRNEYDGYLDRDGETIEALEGENPKNEIQR
ncbi:MAG TPA: LysM peptidoglycan-binding domain-containing M23 family metallopeptidase [Anaerolineales bacterium]|nr:LysM peptidoglycan-binding domain-containing M23 family metallopeptidase [Anaerolineales bacterium]